MFTVRFEIITHEADGTTGVLAEGRIEGDELTFATDDAGLGEKLTQLVGEGGLLSSHCEAFTGEGFKGFAVAVDLIPFSAPDILEYLSATLGLEVLQRESGDEA